ncbi:MAG: DUF2161 family putative PD-(D/E)XK-type phosphodiesterase [Pseudomonadota bacterium]
MRSVLTGHLFEGKLFAKFFGALHLGSMRETDLYPVVKDFLEGQGYDVKAEVTDCDVVALRGDEPPLIVELKTGLNLTVVLQAVDRLAVSDTVYLAVPSGAGPKGRRRKSDVVKLCRRLGLGFLLVDLKRNLVEVQCDPGPYQPRRQPKREAALLKEFAKREGDFNTGGQSGRPLVTAYRQDALRLCKALQEEPNAPKFLKQITGVERAGVILRDNHYGWFFRVEKGVYALSEAGGEALEVYADVVKALK